MYMLVMVVSGQAEKHKLWVPESMFLSLDHSFGDVLKEVVFAAHSMGTAYSMGTA